jgi:hypothetical protein
VDEIDDRSPDSPRPAMLPELRVDGPWCQRWRDRRYSWRHRSDGGFDPDRYRVAPIEEAAAKAFVTAHHYSGTYPAAVRRYGMWDQPTGQLVGVAVYGVPMSLRVLTNVLPDLEPLTESLELSRFVPLDGPGNQDSERSRVRCNRRRWTVRATGASPSTLRDEAVSVRPFPVCRHLLTCCIGCTIVS